MTAADTRKTTAYFNRWKKGERLSGLVKESGVERHTLAKAFGALTGEGMVGFMKLRAQGAGAAVGAGRKADTPTKGVTKVRGLRTTATSADEDDDEPGEM